MLVGMCKATTVEEALKEVSALMSLGHDLCLACRRTNRLVSSDRGNPLAWVLKGLGRPIVLFWMQERESKEKKEAPAWGAHLDLYPCLAKVPKGQAFWSTLQWFRVWSPDFPGFGVASEVDLCLHAEAV